MTTGAAFEGTCMHASSGDFRSYGYIKLIINFHRRTTSGMNGQATTGDRDGSIQADSMKCNGTSSATINQGIATSK